MLRPLPFHDADRVVMINEHTPPQFPLLSLSGGKLSRCVRRRAVAPGVRRVPQHD